MKTLFMAVLGPVGGIVGSALKTVAESNEAEARVGLLVPDNDAKDAVIARAKAAVKRSRERAKFTPVAPITYKEALWREERKLIWGNPDA